MKIRKDINLNFVRKLSFEKEFLIEDDTIFLPKKDMYNGDFTLSDKSEENKGLSIKKTTYFSDYQFNKPLNDQFYSEKTIKFRPDQFEKKTNYWNKTNEVKKTENTYYLIKNIKNKKEIKKISGVLSTLSTGYITVVPGFQLGQYWNTIVKNSVEGLKVKLGFRTFKTVDDRFRLGGFLGYGTKDKKFKYSLEAKYLLSYKPRIAVGVAYLKDVEQLGAKLLNTNGLNANVFDPNALFSRGDNFFLSLVDKKVIQFDIELKKGFHFGFSLAHNNITSASPKKFNINYLDDAGNVQSNLTNVSTDIYITYTPGRFEYGYGVEQKMGRNLYPALVINYKKGYKNFLGGTHNYDKIQFNYNHPILLGKLGVFITTLNGGKTFWKSTSFFIKSSSSKSNFLDYKKYIFSYKLL